MSNKRMKMFILYFIFLLIFFVFCQMLSMIIQNSYMTLAVIFPTDIVTKNAMKLFPIRLSDAKVIDSAVKMYAIFNIGSISID